MGSLTDPQNNLVYQMHQYLDTDGSGTHSECVSSTVGAERLVAATNWLRANGKVGIIGEFAGGVNTQCQTAIKGMLDYMQANAGTYPHSLGGRAWWGRMEVGVVLLTTAVNRRLARRPLVGRRSLVERLHL